MLAHHPETGAPIRILRSDAQITQSRRTLVWLRAEYSKSSRWQRWNVLITDPACWCGEATAVVIESFDAAWVPILRAIGETCLVVYKDRGVEKGLKKAGFATDNYLSYVDLFHMYPFLGEPVFPTDPIEKVVVSLAHILRFPYLAWTPSATAVDSAGVKAQIQAWQETCGGQQQVLPAAAVAEEAVPACWLIQQYFKHGLSRRAREITLCLEKNLANPYIDRVFLLNEHADFELPASDKLVTRVIGHRLTYQDVLECVRTEVPAGAFVVFANSDIWCDESLAVLWRIPLVERRLFLGLLRWDHKEGEDPVLFGPRPDSQDAWILAKATVDFAVTEEEFGFPFGKPGCDNAIALAMLKKRCLVVNPAYSIKTHHAHASNIRDYNPRDILYKPMYLYMDPTAIQLFAVEEHMKSWESKATGWRHAQSVATFSRRIHCVNDAAKTVCRTLADRENQTFQADGPNLWTPSVTGPLYELQNAFASDTGLLSNFGAIFVGQHAAWRDGWQDSTISSISTTLHVPAMISVTVGAECWKSLAAWCIQYLPTVLRLRKLAGCEYEFLVPTVPQAPPFLYDCRWQDDHVGTVPHIPNTQYYCGKILAPAPGPTRISKEDVALLRELLPVPKRTGRTVVVCLEEGADALFHTGWVEEWRTCHAVLLRGSTVLTVRPSDSHKVRREAFQAADWIFGRREALQWIWMARAGTRVVEWMLETEITSDIVHLAGAAECKYILSLVRKEPVEFQRQNALLEFAKIWAEWGFPELVAQVSEKPVVLVPKGAVTEFREMVQLWGERGYCDVLETEGDLVWWGSVGDTVLFDREPRHWNPATNYQLALFGCAPPDTESARQSVWSYWPRNPRALETAAESRFGWSERPLTSVFLGKVANGVQKMRRCTQDWSAAVELFSMPVDSTEAYPYTQSEYLAVLQKARFGLCLPGTELKCNREIEYMGLGVVPIAVPEVDFTHYLVPPQEGVHYFRATTPAEVRRIVAETTETTWETMSAACHAWWRQNASAEGLFRLTWGRIEQCRPLQGLLMPAWKNHHNPRGSVRIGNV